MQISRVPTKLWNSTTPWNKTKFKNIFQILNSTLDEFYINITHISLRWMYRSAKIDWTKKPIWVYSSSPDKWGRNNKILKRIKQKNLKYNYHCSDPLEGGGTIHSNMFFVPWIFADRYIHRRELRLVSSESASSVGNGIKKIFLISVFYRELSRFKLLRKLVNSHCFYSHFPEFLTKISPILLKFIKIFKNSVVDFFLKTNKHCWLFWLNFCGKKFWINFSKFSLFRQKQREKSYFSPLWLEKPAVHSQTTTTEPL